jgi:hypothetical protein
MLTVNDSVKGNSASFFKIQNASFQIENASKAQLLRSLRKAQK